MTKYGKDVIWKAFILSAILILISFVINIKSARIIILSLSLIILVFTLFFFRDPKRKIKTGIEADVLILSPADGKIIKIANVDNINKDILSDKCYKLISIFLSPLNVHINRIPISGKIVFLNHIKGKFKAAYRDKSSELNERTEIAINSKKGVILFRQVAGFLARRIICDLKEGDEVFAGTKFGMIKFGSRVDIFIPENSEIFVSLGDRVKAGETIIAKLI